MASMIADQHIPPELLRIDIQLFTFWIPPTPASTEIAGYIL